MSFSKPSESFGKVFENSEFTVVDQLVKVGYVPRGHNIILGRHLSGEDYSELLFLGKVAEKCTGKSYLNADVYLDTTFPHVIYITGTRGSGKSFDLGVLLEGISELSVESTIQNSVTPITSIVLDTQSQFWTLGYEPNSNIPENRAQIEQLKRWNIQPNKLEKLKVFVPPGTDKVLGYEEDITLRPRDVTAEDWCSLFDQELYGPQGHIISETMRALVDRDFEISDIVSYISDDANWPGIAEQSRNALLYRFSDYQSSGLFRSDGNKIQDLLTPGYCHLIMLRELRNQDKSLLTSILARKLFDIMGKMHLRKKHANFFDKDFDSANLPSKVWLVIDEAHVVAPKDANSPARSALIEYVKRGRDAGLSLVLATQQPSALDDRILSQVNLSINHRLTFQSDINAATNRLPTKAIRGMKLAGQTINDFGDMIRLLSPGAAFVSDHEASRAIMIQIRPRVTAHGGYSPF